MPDIPVCFVISPIGEKASPVRKRADDVYELIVEPALERFGFRVVRADKLETIGSITSEVIEYIQKSELCIVDVTGLNANVMYECGRRHETGKPYIMIAQEGEKLPFDISTIRTVFFTLESARETRQSVTAIQGLVGKLVSDGFQSSGGDSLSSLAESIRRIERRIDQLVANPAPASANKAQAQQARELVPNLAISQTRVGGRIARLMTPRMRDAAVATEASSVVVV